MSIDDSDLLGATPGRGRTIDQFVELIVREVLLRMRVGMPAHVVEWKAPVSAGPKSKPALVRVQPHFFSVVRMNTEAELTPALQAEGWEALQENDGWVRRRRLPEIPNCPVAYVGPAGMLPRGPLKVGETGWLAFADRSLDRWIQTGGPVDPVFQDFHLLNDAVFLPGLRYGTSAASIDEDRFVVGPENGSAGLFIDDVAAPTLPDIEVRTDGSAATLDAATEVKLGALATLGVARLNDAVSPSVAMAAWALVVETFINGLVPGTFTPANSFAGTVLNVFASISQASSKVKAE